MFIHIGNSLHLTKHALRCADSPGALKHTACLPAHTQDYNSNWCMAIEMLNDDTYLASEIW